MFADIHSHILPGIDDGAPDLNASRALLAALRQEGITHLALTPHYYPYQKSIDAFLRDRAKAFAALSASPEAEGMTFALGAEVYLTESLFGGDDLLPLCYQGTRLMLTELEYTRTFTQDTRRRLSRLAYDHSITPVLAHIERFPFFSDPALLADLRRMGCLFQINLRGLYPRWTRRRLCRFFEEGLVDLVGEDVHREVMRGAERAQLAERTEKRAPQLFDTADANALALIFS